MEGVVLVQRWCLASANTLNLAPNLVEPPGDLPTLSVTCNQREMLAGIGSAHPVVTNKPVQRQISTSEVRIGRLQPNRGHTAPRRAPTGHGDPCPSPAPCTCPPKASRRAPLPLPPALHRLLSALQLGAPIAMARHGLKPALALTPWVSQAQS